ncbi:hypothetical protein P4G96_26870 [Bacillus cereus]|nr:hypothetical protein [Bacillus cereus]
MNWFVRYWYQLMIEHDTSFVHKRKLSLANKLVLTAFIMSFLYCWIYAGFCRIMMNRLYKVLY